MADELQTQGQETQTQTGVDTGSVAGGQGIQTQQTQQTQPGSEPSPNVDQIVATRISQREAQIREDERQRILQEMQVRQAAQPVGQPQQLDWNLVNDQFYNAFTQNPAQTVYQLADAIAQQRVSTIEGRLKDMAYRQNLMQLATNHIEDIREVAPLMKPILEKYPHLRDDPEGLEFAYNAAKGVLSNQQTQAAVERERQIMAQNNQVLPGAAPQGTANQQGGAATTKTPEEAVADMIVNAK